VTWIKDPDETLDFGIDWAPVIGEDPITTSDWIDPTPGIDVGTGARAPTHTATTTTVWLSGGTPGVEYKLTNRIVTTGGRTYDKDVTIRITSVPAALPNFAGCVWPIDPACLGLEWDKHDTPTQQRAVSLASATLTRLTAGRVGDCPVRVRPDVQHGCCVSPYPLFGFGLIDTYNGHIYASDGILPGAYCFRPRELTLPGPIYKIVEVKVAGVVIPATDYEVHNQSILVYTGTALDAWPSTQDFTLGSDQPGTFEVTYLNTAPVDGAGAYAAGLMAVQFAKACSGDKSCKFPSNVASVVRTGLSIEIVTGSFPNGQTGIREVDAYVAQWNRNGRGKSSVFDPGAPDHRIVTG
jgi:hypothetical protein